MSKPLYKINIKLFDGNIELKAEPQIDVISKFYGKVMAGIEQELIDNMPVEGKRKLLYQLLDSYIMEAYYEEEHDSIATLMSALSNYYGV